MKLMPFKPSERYLHIQLAPYFLLSIALILLSWLWQALWLDIAALVVVAVGLSRLVYYSSITYILTPHGLIVTSGVITQYVYYRPISDLLKMQRERPGLLRRFHLVNLRLGLAGPPADRLTLYGIDDLQLIDLLLWLDLALVEKLAFLEHLSGTTKKD